MALFFVLWGWAQEVSRSIDPTTAWTIISIEGGVIGGLGLYIAAQQKRHEKKVTAMGEKINELYDKRIEDMKGSIDLVKTLEGVIYKERKGGK